MAQFDHQLKVLESLGITIVDNLEFSEWSPKYSNIDRAEWRLSFRLELRESKVVPYDPKFIFMETKNLGEDMAKFLGGFENNSFELHTLADFIAYTKRTPEELYEKYGMKQWIQAEEIGQTFNLDSEEYKTSRSRRLTIGRQIPELLPKHSCDILVAPPGLIQQQTMVAVQQSPYLWDVIQEISLPHVPLTISL